ncbi:MAG: LUD domain-containing protein [Muribaculaceae bacterium]|nr:LUD domain-containing protein [Muribaculaceae bacterium]
MNIDDNTLNARDRILARVRANRPRSYAHPKIPVYAIAGDPLENFISHVEGFDGKVIQVNSRGEAISWLKENLTPSPSYLVLSAVEEYTGNVTADQIKKPADAEKLSACIGEGILGIGETGSVLVTPESFGQMANGLFTRNLYLLLEKNKITDGLQDAYAHMDLSKIQYSSLFSGPSATADIEAVHITGAQGPVSLTVLLY